MLDTQYRCHPSISSFPSRRFYDGRLQDGANVKSPNYSIPYLSTPDDLDQPLTLFDVSLGEEAKGGRSYNNPLEARVALNLYLKLRSLEMFPFPADNKSGVKFEDSSKVGIGIITPYRDQLILLQKLFREHNLLGDPLLQLNTVDGYQGREFDVIIFSCVRATKYEEAYEAEDAQKKRASIGFLNDARRLNVAITRAKYKLFDIGQARALRTSKLWRAFLENVENLGKVVHVKDKKSDWLQKPVKPDK
jgi:senataxin